ncbi:MAG: hypothetical protein GX610_23805 [Rhodococcus sp.]|nr:hypothetical protein [Rhodococcus sp. (in: high G+C Gram-positive bacteria)]
MGSRLDKIGGFLATPESMICGPLGWFLSLVLFAPWAGAATALCMTIGLAVGMIVGAFIHRARTSGDRQESS